MPLDQSKRQIGIDTPLGANVLVLRNFTATEELGRLFQIDAELLSENFEISFPQIVGQNVTIRLNTIQASPRFFNGHVRAFRQIGSVGRLAHYHAVIVPKLWFLTHSADCRIFQNKTVPDIVKEVLQEGGISEIEETLTASYPKWEYCVQYRETDFNFISRLMEQEGIYYYFKHAQGKHTLILADGESSHPKFPGYADMSFHQAGHELVKLQGIREWAMTQEVQAGKYVLNDYNFQKPKTSLLGQAQIQRQNVEADHELYDYPGEYDEVQDADSYSRTRIEEAQSGFEIAEGSGDVRGIAAGFEIKINGLSRSDQIDDYLILSTVTSAETEGFLSDGGADGTGDFSCSFTAARAKSPFRPARLTPKPIIQGAQTAVVTGPKGEEIYTDKYGRIKVQFHWDRLGKADENTTCFIRVAQFWAGRKWGAMFLPRIGQEVVVSFLEGDPDQPLVVGSVYNGDQMPFYPLPDHKTKSTIKSNSSKGGEGFNEFRFEDKKGGEQVFIHSEKRMDVRVKASVFETNGANRDINIGAKGSKYPGGHLSVTVGNDENRHINAGQYERVEKKLNQGVVGDVVEGYDANLSTIVKAKTELNSREITFEALTKITLKVGSSFIVVDLSGITIQGPMVKINSGGAATGTGDPEIEDPLDAETADTGEPGFLERPRPAGGGGRKKRKLTSQHGPSVTLSPDGKRFLVGKAISIDGKNPAFVTATLNDLALIGTTPKGQALLTRVDSSGRTVNINERPPNPADPFNAETGPTNPNDAVPVDLGGTGRGSDSSIAYDPSVWPPPAALSPTQTPSDVTLFHELTHADHHMHGQRRTSQPRADNFDNQEEFNTITDENDYRDQRNPKVGKLTNGHHEL